MGSEISRHIVSRAEVGATTQMDPERMRDLLAEAKPEVAAEPEPEPLATPAKGTNETLPVRPTAPDDRWTRRALWFAFTFMLCALVAFLARRF